jgi:hypothetical protein
VTDICSASMRMVNGVLGSDAPKRQTWIVVWVALALEFKIARCVVVRSFVAFLSSSNNPRS